METLGCVFFLFSRGTIVPGTTLQPKVSVLKWPQGYLGRGIFLNQGKPYYLLFLSLLSQCSLSTKWSAFSWRKGINFCRQGSQRDRAAKPPPVFEEQGEDMFDLDFQQKWLSLGNIIQREGTTCGVTREKPQWVPKRHSHPSSECKSTREMQPIAPGSSVAVCYQKA